MTYIVKQFDTLAELEAYLNVELEHNYDLVQMVCSDHGSHNSYACVFRLKSKT